MNESKRYLTCKRVTFYAQSDEDAFFYWIKNIKCIASFEGAGDELYLDLIDGNLKYEDVKDLIALFYRYKINMKQLQPLLNSKNKRAFEPWRKQIFGNAKSKK